MAQFVKGHPGGPGRPRGSRNVVNQILDQFASSEGKALVRKMVERALEGDRVAARPRGPLAQKSNGRELPRYEQGPMVH